MACGQKTVRLLNAGTAVGYANRRLETHLGNLRLLLERADGETVEEMRGRNNLFSGLDLAGLYRTALSEPAAPHRIST